MTGVLALAGVVVTGLAASASPDPCVTGGNAIVCENSKPGVGPQVWDIDGAGDSSIQGYAADISVDAGQRIDFKIDTDASAYTIDIYRTGYYQGLGARLITSVPVDVSLPQSQPQCMNDVTTELYDCGNWGVSAHWNVPTDATSGVYVAKLTRADDGGSSHITFIVRDDDSTSDIVFQTSDTTWHAYNTYGGSDFYQGAANGRAFKLSYNRPFATRDGVEARDFYFGAEYPMVRFLEQNGYDVSYIAGVDTDRHGDLLLNHGTFLSVGHDEYWSGTQRANVQAARDAGVNLAFFSGNEMYWHTRWEQSAAGTPTDYRTLVSYKETWANKKIDPSSEWTGTWRDPRYAAATDGGSSPENALIGTMYMVNYSDLAVTVSAEEGKFRLWRNTGLGNQAAGTSTALAAHTVGYESNEVVNNGFTPNGLIKLSTTTGAVPEYLQDYGNTVATGQTTHHVTLYRASSGALVFSAASVQWTWGLDATHDGDGAPADVRMRQATLNLLADMGNQPMTRAGDLVAGTASTDTVGPTVQLTAPIAGASVANGTQITVTGSASDAGGRVAAVEVSLDGGATWSTATGTGTWTFTGVLSGLGAVAVQARGVDDSANIGAPASVALTVTGPASLYGATVPPVTSAADSAAVELGTRFSPSVDGYVQGVRFYKGAANTGTHTGSLWSATGQRLATVTFTDESATGWQVARFTQPVAVSAGQTYVVSYSAPNGGYAIQTEAFAYRGITSAPLSTVGGYGAQQAGVFGSVGTFPAQTWGRPSYFVDVQFSTVDDSPLSAMDRTPADGTVSVSPSTPVSVRFSRNVTPASVRLVLTDSVGHAVTGTTAYDAATRTATFTPVAALDGFVEYTATVSATADDGRPVSSGGTWTFRTQRPDSAACPCGLFPESETPGIVDINDGSPVTLATRVTPAKAGTVSGVEFYRGPASAGAVTVYLWGPDHSVLASAAVTDPVTSGWQRVEFATPVAVAGGAEYTVGYRIATGRYSATVGRLASPVTNGSLTSPANAGAYTYGEGYPASSVSTSYLVDALYTPDEPNPTIASTSPAGGAVDVDPATSVSVTASAPIAVGATLTVRDALGVAVDGVATTLNGGLTLTFAPAHPFSAGASYTAAFTGSRAADGKPFPATSWSFVTRAATSGCPCTVLGSVTPGTVDGNDGAAVELGMAFTPSSNGLVTGVRFYKAAANTGTHTGSLWDAAGNRLATVTFSGETGTGWQTASFSTPVPVKAGTAYVVSYLAPNGRYSADVGGFAAVRTVGPLTTPVNAGRYLYGGGFPQFSWNATNYYVDAVYTEDPLTASSMSPAAAETGVSPSTTVSATLSYAPVGVQPTLALTVGGSAVTGASTFDAATATVTFTPAAALPVGSVTATVSAGGHAVRTWTFDVANAPNATGAGLWTVDDVPAVAAWDDPDSVQVGTRLRVDQSGSVTGIRFYKGAGNTGTHTGYLWSTTGTLLASGTFTGESSTGWQTLVFATPVHLAAGTEVVASYNAPSGHYAVTAGALGAPRTVGPLTSLANGGTYRYGSTSFPSTTSAHSFWVDVLFVADPVTSTPSPTPTATAQPELAGTGLWSLTDSPQTATYADPDAVQVGTRLRVTEAGTVTGMRFYKGVGNTGTHTGYLWSSSGQLLASATFVAETSTGWQSVAFDQPVALASGADIVVSYTAPAGHYALTAGGLATSLQHGPVQSIAPGGAYVYGTTFPSFTASHAYWVDISFVPSGL